MSLKFAPAPIPSTGGPGRSAAPTTMDSLYVDLIASTTDGVHTPKTEARQSKATEAEYEAVSKAWRRDVKILSDGQLTGRAKYKDGVVYLWLAPYVARPRKAKTAAE